MRTSVPAFFLALYAVCATAATEVDADHAGAYQGSQTPLAAVPALDLNAYSSLDAIIPQLADKRVVFVGEQHTRYDHHLVQLEIIRRLHALDPRVAIGMEMFQQPFQQYLDAYLDGDSDEWTMLKATEYFLRWRMDYRHYAPILQFAREHRLPVIALNVPAELTRKVGRGGVEGLNDEERRQVPAEMAPADAAYRARIEEVFRSHPQEKGQKFEHFLEAQLLWDEGMAESAADFLKTHPDYRLVVIAGNQHVAWGTTIPQRLQRRLSVPMASILNSWQGPVEPGLADFLLMPPERRLPPAGKLGIVLKESKEHVVVATCLDKGACAVSGMKRGDRITRIDEADIDTVTDLRLAMWGKQPGDTVNVAIIRKRALLPDKHMSFDLTLK